MINNLTAKYTKLSSGGYMGQLIERTEVIKDAVEQMVLAYNE